MSLENALNLLTQHHSSSISKIPPHLSSSYKLIKYAKIYNPRLLNHFLNLEYKPTDIIPGTIGAWLFGCMQCKYGEIGRGDTPLCLNKNSIYPIWIQSKAKGDVRFVLFYNSILSQTFHIFVKPSFSQFTSTELNVFIENGAKILRVYITRYSKHYLLYIHDLRHMKTVKRNLFGISIPTSISRKNYAHSTYEYTYLIFIILIVLIIIFLMRRTSI